MSKKMSVLSLLWIALTSMVGSGWLFGSLYSAHYAGPAALLAWPIAGFLLMVVALAFAELGTMFPQADNLACLPLYTHGRLTSVIMSYLAWLSLAAIPMIETQALLQYASNYIPGLMKHQELHFYITPRGYRFALVVLFSFVVLNYFGLRLFERINGSFTIWKIVIPTITIIALFYMGYHVQNFSHYGGFMPYGWHGVMAAMSNGGVLFSLLGFRQVIVMMGEVENSGKYVPLILISALLLTIILYTGLQCAFIGTLHPQNLVNGWANLTFPGDAGPFAALALMAGLAWLSGLLYLDAFISPYATAFVYSTTASRFLASLSTAGNAAEILSRTNKYQVPWVSLLLNFILAALLFGLLRSWEQMSAFLVAAMMISYALGPICLICLRHQLPNYLRPFRVRCSTVVSLLGFYICTAGVYWAGVFSVIRLLVLTIAGICIYIFYMRVVKKSARELDIKNALWLLVYLISLGIFSICGNYGGKHLLPPYWDLVYLFGVSVIIFYMAFRSKKPKEYTQSVINIA